MADREATPVTGGTREAAPEPRPQLGPYRLIKRLGGGGMGQIYLAEQPSVGRQVAIKILPPDSFDDANAVARFQREIQILGKLSHPNICPVLEAGVDGSTQYYVMELIRGIDLAKVIRTQRMDPRRAVEIAIQVGRALQFAHDNGIIHRDLKPLNVMVTRGERRKEPLHARPASSSFVTRLFSRKPVAKADDTVDAAPADPALPSPGYVDRVFLIDFGLARQGKKTSLTASGEMVGTPAYMSPEQARGDVKSVGPASDVYSLGATLYEMLTLQPPFSGESLPEILMQVVTSDPLPPSRHNPHVDRDLETIVLKAMDKEPRRRYASAAAMTADLERWLAGEAIEARPASLVYRVRKRVLRNKLASAGFGVAAALVAALLWFFAGPGTVEVTSDVDGAVVSIDGRERSGARFTIWPPRTVKLRVSKDWFLFEQEVAVRARSVERVHAAMAGRLTVKTTPEKATVVVNGRAIGGTPLENARVPAGRLEVRLQLADYETLVEAPLVKAGEETRIERPLRHEQGTISMTSYPAEVAIELVPIGRAGKSTLTSARTTQLPLDTGRYRAKARARNHFPREFDIEVRAGQDAKRHVTLNPMLLWQHNSGGHIGRLAAGDVDRDGRTDLVLLLESPVRLVALRGIDGRPLWQEPLRGEAVSMHVADLDGDLALEAVVFARDDVRFFDAATGRVLRSLPTGPVDDGWIADDLDGDALPDLLLFSRAARCLIAIGGVSGAQLWTAPVPYVHALPQRARLAGGVDGFLVGCRAENEQFRGSAFAMEARTGRVLWTSGLDLINPGMRVDANRDGVDDLAVVLLNQEMAVLDGRDGSLLWRKAVREGEDSRAIGATSDINGDGHPEIIQHDSKIKVIDAASGETLAVAEDARTSWAQPVAADADGDGLRDILVSSDGAMCAFHARTGAELWRFETTGMIRETPVLGDFNGDGRQDVAVASSTGELYVLETRDPPVLWRHHFPNGVARVLFREPGQPIVTPMTDLRVLNPADGHVIASSPDIGTALYATTHEGARLLAVTTMKGAGLVDITDPTRPARRWFCEDKPAITTAEFHDVNADGVPDVVWGEFWWTQEMPLLACDGRTGEVLWRKARQYERTVHGRCALDGGVLYIPCRDGLHAARATTGEPLWKLATRGQTSSVTVVDGDLVTATSGGDVLRLRPTGTAARVVWHARAAGEPSAFTPVVGGGRVYVSTHSGFLHVFGVSDGREIWRAPVGGSLDGTIALHDVDGDGLEDVAVGSNGGPLCVLSGRDGARLFTYVGLDWHQQAPLWTDLDGDGRLELVAGATTNDLLAFRVDTREATPVTWSAHNAFTDRDAAAETERIARAARAQAWRRDGRAGEPDARASAAELYEAAMAAHREGRDARELAERARERGCRRLDLELVRAGDAAEAAARALASAPPEQLAQGVSDARLRELWRRSLPLVRTDAVRALLASAPFEPWERLEELFEQAVAGGAARSVLVLARARAAIAAERYEEARRALVEAAGFADTRDAALAEEARLDARAAEERARAVSVGNAGKPDEALVIAERALRMKPDDPDSLYVLSWWLTHAPGGDSARGADVARRGLERVRSLPAVNREAVFRLSLSLGAALMKSGDLDGAQAAAREALAHAFWDADAQRARRLLKEIEARRGDR